MVTSRNNVLTLKLLDIDASIGFFTFLIKIVKVPDDIYPIFKEKVLRFTEHGFCCNGSLPYEKKQPVYLINYRGSYSKGKVMAIDPE